MWDLIRACEARMLIGCMGLIVLYCTVLMILEWVLDLIRMKGVGRCPDDV
jgi:hypothetical protein